VATRAVVHDLLFIAQVTEIRLHDGPELGLLDTLGLRNSTGHSQRDHQQYNSR
jgi:hypothetical protein